MGTNFYLFTQNKEHKELFGNKLFIVDTPEFGYELHIAKTSCGWLPLFEAHENIKSVKDIKAIYNKGDVRIFDEYGTEYHWDEFVERVLEFDGGTADKRVIEKRDIDKTSPFYDPEMPDIFPISHFEYKGITQYPDTLRRYFKDDEGYEFCETEFY